MNKYLLLSTLLLVTPVGAQTLSWDAAAGADGYQVSYEPVAGGTELDVDTGATHSLDLSTLSLADGVRYGFYVRSYAGDPVAYSMPSDTLRWTPAPAPIVVETPETPRQLILNFAP